MLTKHPVPYFCLAMILVAAGCKQNHESRNFDPPDSKAIPAIYLHPKEISGAGIAYGSINKQSIERQINNPGKPEVQPENITCIASPASGQITLSFFQKGDLIKAGSVVATLENGDFLTLQQNYLEALNQYEYARLEYARQGELSVDNATSLKKMQIAKRDYQSAEINASAYRAQLEILGLNADSIKPHKLTPRVVVAARRSGSLYRHFIISGAYVKKGDPLFELLNNPELIAETIAGVDTIRTVSKDAILHDGTIFYVFARKNGLFQRFQIRPGISMGNQVEIQDLPAEITDSLVVSGMSYLNSHIKTQ